MPTLQDGVENRDKVYTGLFMTFKDKKIKIRSIMKRKHEVNPITFPIKKRYKKYVKLPITFYIFTYSKKT